MATSEVLTSSLETCTELIFRTRTFEALALAIQIWNGHFFRELIFATRTWREHVSVDRWQMALPNGLRVLIPIPLA
jgi:hypothetical protein